MSKLKPYDADQAWRDHLERVARREPYLPSIFHTTYPFSRYPLYLYYSKRPTMERPYDPLNSYLDWFDRMNEFDKLFPSLAPVSRLLSPTPTKVISSSKERDKYGYTTYMCFRLVHSLHVHQK